MGQLAGSDTVALPFSDRRYAAFLHLFRMEIIQMFSDPANVRCIAEFQEYFESEDDIPTIMAEVGASDNGDAKVSSEKTPR
ncbi:hypothetical protein GCK32_022501 [Trichostrongylus colubriformis]|uniref:Uncharacterized protein n=1 Tax=Trichostrongylus colubriformis TaxID=6319 RepID=A0AAN8FZ29_TRICO